jgi:Fe-S cluster assembly scaffold protein SufB
MQFKKGLTKGKVVKLSKLKKEPDWMLEMRLRGYKYFEKSPMPEWGADLSQIDFEKITYYSAPDAQKTSDWKDVPQDIKQTFDKLGIPEAERKFLAGYSFIKRACEELGVKLLAATGNYSYKNMPSFYNQIDVLALASINEGFGAQIAEASAMNILVISTEVGVAKEIPGIDIVERNSKSIKQAISKYNKRPFILKNYSQKRVNSDFYKLYISLINTKEQELL